MNSDSKSMFYEIGDRSAGKGFTHAKLANYAIILLVALMVAGPWITYKPAPFTGEGSPLRQYSYVMVLAMVIYACRLREYPSRLLTLPVSLTIALAYCWISLSWSDVAGVALRRVILTTLIIWTIFAAIRVSGFDDTLKSLRSIMIVILVLNFIAAVFFPSFGIHTVGGFAETDDGGIIGDWRGVMSHKNFAGPFCAVTILTFLFCNKDMTQFKRWAVILGALLFLIMTASKTSMGILALSLSVGTLVSFYNVRFRIIVMPLLLIVIGLIVILAVFNWDVLIAPLQREDALTGRVQIWPVLIAYWHDHVWLGSGYGSFWNVGATTPIFSYVKANNWVGDQGQGHNGYLDLLVALGLPGLILVVICVIIWPLARLLWIVNVPGDRRGYTFALVMFCAFHNLTESTLFERDAIVNVFLMMALALVEVMSREGQYQAPPSRNYV